VKRHPNLRHRPEQPVLFEPDEPPPGAYGSAIRQPDPAAGWAAVTVPAPVRSGPEPAAEAEEEEEDHPMFGPSEAARYERSARRGPDPRAAVPALRPRKIAR